MKAQITLYMGSGVTEGRCRTPFHACEYAANAADPYTDMPFLFSGG